MDITDGAASPCRDSLARTRSRLSISTIASLTYVSFVLNTLWYTNIGIKKI